MSAVASKELIAASTRPMVLGILAAGENYGYAIIREVQRLSGGSLDWKEGMLYPVLHRLEADGLVTAAWRQAEGRRRKYYRVTEQGLRVLGEDRRAWQDVNAALGRAWAGAFG